MDEKQINEQESLQLINRMIYEAIGYYYENILSALAYGFVVLFSSLLSFFMAQNGLPFPFQQFYIFIPVFFIQAWMQYKHLKKKGPQVYRLKYRFHVESFFS
jgi:amino acid permease